MIRPNERKLIEDITALVDEFKKTSVDNKTLSSLRIKWDKECSSVEGYTIIWKYPKNKKK